MIPHENWLICRPSWGWALVLIVDNHSIRDLCWLRYTAKLIVNLVLETWVIDEEGKIVFFSLSLSIQLEFNIMTYSISIKFLCLRCMKVIQIFWYIIVCIDCFLTFTYKNMSSERKKIAEINKFVYILPLAWMANQLILLTQRHIILQFYWLFMFISNI